MVSMFKREIKVGNAVIEYSGSDHVIERINCTDRIEEEIIVQVFCFSSQWLLKKNKTKKQRDGGLQMFRLQDFF